MDSLYFMRQCVWTLNRDQADTVLAGVLAWVGAWAVPQRVFSRSALHQWALDFGYSPPPANFKPDPRVDLGLQ
jgi:hypothetical protein